VLVQDADNNSGSVMQQSRCHAIIIDAETLFEEHLRLERPRHPNGSMCVDIQKEEALCDCGLSAADWRLACISLAALCVPGLCKVI